MKEAADQFRLEAGAEGPEKEPLSGGQILDLLRERYAPPTWTFFHEVFSRVGGGSCSRADGIAIAMWRSRGLEIQGFEVKASRTDWLRELRNPKKSEEFFSYCDRWWLVSAEGAAAPVEIPLNWGWMVARGKTLSIKKKAKDLKPKPPGREFLCSIIRLAYGYANSDPTGKLGAEYDRGFEEGKIRAESHHSFEREQFEATQKIIGDFQIASGLAISSWNAGEIGEAVHLLMNGGLDRRRRELIDLKKAAERTAEAVGKALAELEGMPEPEPEEVEK